MRVGAENIDDRVDKFCAQRPIQIVGGSREDNRLLGDAVLRAQRQTAEISLCVDALEDIAGLDAALLPVVSIGLEAQDRDTLRP